MTHSRERTQRCSTEKGSVPNGAKRLPHPKATDPFSNTAIPEQFKHPSKEWVTMLEEELGMTDHDFKTKTHEGRSPIDLTRDLSLSPEHIEKISEIVGPSNITTDIYQRVKYAYGKTTLEMMELARGHVREISDVVVHPRHKEDVRALVGYCNRMRIPLYVFSGGSSVTLGLRPSKGGITLALATHMNRFWN